MHFIRLNKIQNIIQFPYYQHRYSGVIQTVVGITVSSRSNYVVTQEYKKKRKIKEQRWIAVVRPGDPGVSEWITCQRINTSYTNSRLGRSRDTTRSLYLTRHVRGYFLADQKWEWPENRRRSYNYQKLFVTSESYIAPREFEKNHLNRQKE